jgi:predicted phosphodiesterase
VAPGTVRYPRRRAARNVILLLGLPLALFALAHRAPDPAAVGAAATVPRMDRARRWARELAPVVVGILGAAIALQAFGRTAVDAGPFTVRLEADFGRGVTDISLPPLGQLRADTHTSPLHLRATLQEVDIDDLREGIRRGLDSVAAEVERTTLDVVDRFAALVGLVGVAGAFLLGLVAFRTRWRPILRATASGLVLVLASVTLTAASFDTAAFRTPSYTGTLELVPQLFGPIQGAIERVDYFREQLRRVVAGAARAYDAVESSPLGPGAEVRVLHVSDVHLSVLGLGFARELAESFDVDLVVDTGDTTSFGTPTEELILSEIRRFGRPYVFVRGNHDSPGFQSAMSTLPNAIVLDGETVEVAGLRIYGIGDPFFIEARGAPQTDEEIVALVESAGPEILADLETLPEPPDVVAVHDHRMAEVAAGAVPLVVSGHFHRNEVRAIDGTIFLEVGTTGGAGPTGFTEEGDPFSAEVLYFQPDEEGAMRLIAWDLVTQFPETSSLQIERHLSSEVLEPSPTPTPTLSPTLEPIP